MCGRFSLINAEANKLKKRFKVKKTPKGLKPRYNIAPGQSVAVISNKNPEEITEMRWGLVPHWAKEINTRYSMINARAESILEKPAYREPFRDKRCLIIADSFYEWKKTASGKVPYRIKLKDNELFAFAGIWDMWDKDGEELYSCSIITTGPNELMSGIHERMPVILRRENEERYISGETGAETAIKLMLPYENGMEAVEISKLVNSPANDRKEVIDPA